MTATESPRFPHLLTAPEAAKCLRIGERTLRDLVKRGAIKFIAVSPGASRPKKMFAPDDLSDFLEQHRQLVVQCPSINQRKPRRSPMTSKSEVVDFLDRLDRRINGKPPR